MIGGGGCCMWESVQLHRKGKVDKYLGSPHRLLRNISWLFQIPLLVWVWSDSNLIETHRSIALCCLVGDLAITVWRFDKIPIQPIQLTAINNSLTQFNTMYTYIYFQNIQTYRRIQRPRPWNTGPMVPPRVSKTTPSLLFASRRCVANSGNKCKSSVLSRVKKGGSSSSCVFIFNFGFCWPRT